MSEDIHFYPLIRCAVCKEITKDWKWVENPMDEQIYGVCNDCEEQVKKDI